MKHDFKRVTQYVPWLLLLFAVDAFAALLLWLADTQAFHSLMAVILLATFFLFLAVSTFLVHKDRKKEKAFLAFLENPDEHQEELLLKTVSPIQREYICRLADVLRSRQRAYVEVQERLRDYEEYVESWAHEAKTPLSLLTLLLDNRKEELSAPICLKLDHIRNCLQESVDQMLFYARLKGARKDYLFEHINIRLCLEEVLEDYRPLLEEKGFRLRSSLPEANVYADRRSLRFLLGQIISNSIKYCGREPELCFTFTQEERSAVLSIKDNGTGVRACDLPYIFEKGFTGNSGVGRKKATGMGLYLAQGIAKEMNLSLHVNSLWGKGFEMQISFPIIRDIG